MREPAVQQMQQQRRRLLGLAALCALPPAAALAQPAAPPTGWVLPRLPAPPLRLTATDGSRISLAGAVAGKVTAVQLMFTGCSATCPTQGAFFAAIAGRLRSSETQLLSVSIDALGDTPLTMSAWQQKFGKPPAWRGAVADPADVDRLADFMKGMSGKGGTHTTQVFVFDRQARLCYRTGDSPAMAELETLLAHVALLG